ncbi:MAG: hypothetical protein KAS32_31530 [Candidatus Peribacteraceae bacterium]|nr:hypothetical protein [Candidatus Peribacteraceae bacterium]
MIKTVVRHNKPKILVITPLLTGSKISKETKKTIKRNKTPFMWISYMGDGNPCKNTQMALNEYKKNSDLPPYIIKIDNDIIAQRGMLDTMVNTLEDAPHQVSYCYCDFEFKGSVNAKFLAINFDGEYLKKSNYISSCSLIKTKRLMGAGGWVTDDKGFRLLDWALWLKFLKRGDIGIPTSKTSFVAMASPTSVSARGGGDYLEKKKWVQDNFI